MADYDARLFQKDKNYEALQTMNNDFDEFYDIVGTISEYTFVLIVHPWGQYVKEVICPDGSIVNHEINLEWVGSIREEIKKKKAKYKEITRVVSYEEALRISGGKKKIDWKN